MDRIALAHVLHFFEGTGAFQDVGDVQGFASSRKETRHVDRLDAEEAGRAKRETSGSSSSLDSSRSRPTSP